MKAITVRQPWASLIAFRVKTVETRGRRISWRGRIAIHAAQHNRRPLWMPEPVARAVAGHGLGGIITSSPAGPVRVEGWRLPSGVIVGSAVLADCVPIVNEADPIPGGPFVYGDPGNFIQVHDGPDDSAPRYSETEVDLGDYRPGRWALLLDDIAPTTERCPWCWGESTADDPCAVCDGAYVCDPVPARGQQAVPWEWTARPSVTPPANRA